MCVTLEYFLSVGSQVRKSEFCAITFLQPAFDSIFSNVLKRTRSFSKAYIFTKRFSLIFSRNIKKIALCLYSPLRHTKELFCCLVQQSHL